MRLYRCPKGVLDHPRANTSVPKRGAHEQHPVHGVEGKAPHRAEAFSLLPGEVMIKVLPGDKIYQAMEIERGFMRPAILHGFGTSAKQRLPSRLAELAQFGWLPLAAALFGTVDWQPQWLHHNFLPVIGLRVHAKIPPSPLSYQQTVALLGLWERRATMGSQCRALTQAADLTFGLPAVFRTPEQWQTEIKGEVFLVQCAQRIYTGAAASMSKVLIDRPQKWAQWALSVGNVWQEALPCRIAPSQYIVVDWVAGC